MSSDDNLSSDQDLARLAIQDKAAFMQWPLGYTPAAHQEHWCDLIQQHPNLMLFAPAGHGKTTVEISSIINDITRNREEQIGLVTGNEDLGVKILSEIKWHLEYNEDLISAYGRYKPVKADKWSKWQIQVEYGKPTLRKKDATLTALGAMSGIKGVRFTGLYGDDIVDDKNSKTPEKRQAMWDWLWGTLIPRCKGQDTPKRFIGTVEHEDDVYHRFMENNRGFTVIKQQAIIDEIEKKVLWPEKMPYEYLCELRAGNYVQFMKTYQNTVVGSEVAKISQERIDACYDSSRVMHPAGIPDEIRARYKLILMSVDPAWTKKTYSKYAVITTIGITHEGRREIIDVLRMKLEYHELFTWIKNKYAGLRPHLVIVESNQMQRRLAEELSECGIPTKPSHTGASKNDVDAGIPMIYSIISQRQLMLPTGDDASKALSHQLINEILAYPNGTYSDILMTVYFIEKEIRSRQTPQILSNASLVSGKVIHSKFSKRGYGLR